LTLTYKICLLENLNIEKLEEEVAKKMINEIFYLRFQQETDFGPVSTGEIKVYFINILKNII
jgi:hypothetical protein